MATEKRVKEIKKKYGNVLFLSIPNIVGVGIGKLSPEEGEDGFCLRVYVEKDVDIMKQILAKEIEGVRVAVTEVGKIVTH